MTVRRTRKVPTSPERIAAAVPAVALEMFPPEDYRSYFGALTEEVEEITGQHDHGITGSSGFGVRSGVKEATAGSAGHHNI
ncbi:hypothetical protein [Corynebacterium halotolerans]|uniref:hypothetical protein n=1 Tax=Corynebacterium halotolerans TaxID=225326 RepID=UPI003CE91A08